MLSPSSSRIRTKALTIFERLTARYIQYAKHKTLANYLLGMVRPHFLNVISNVIPEPELKNIMWECYQDIEDVKDEFDKAKNLKESREHNTGRMQRFVESNPDYQSVLELVP